jgi:DNA helicase-2/ATP-dependent DNA helicase PcrA
LIEEALRRYRRPYIVVGGLSFYARAEIKDILAYLKLLIAPRDGVSLMRVINTPARGIGKTTIEQIAQHASARKLNLWEALVELVDSAALTGRAHAALSDFRKLIDDLRQRSTELRLDQLLKAILADTGYEAMLKEDKDPSAATRLENLAELLNAAAEAAERLEGPAEFLDHAALVADADAVDARAQISLLTAHNAKGLEFPNVFLAGMEEGLFPHSRSLERPDMIEEERRLCYVGMTRAQQRLHLSWARLRRRYGGGPLEAALPSRFLREIREELCQMEGLPMLSEEEERGIEGPEEVDLYSERHYVREAAQSRAPYPGKTYNSEESIAEFFRQRGLPTNKLSKHSAGAPGQISTPSARPPATQPGAPVSLPPSVAAAAPLKTAAPARPSAIARKQREGMTVYHPKYGRGTVVRREGDGEDAKLTVMFTGHGIKKLIAKYAQLKNDE